MSFSSDVKKELSAHYDHTRHCSLAELAGIMNACGNVSSADNQKFVIKIQTENAVVAKKYFTLVKEAFGVSAEVFIRKSTQLKKARIYSLYVKDADAAKKLLRSTGLWDESGVIKRIAPLVVKNECCKRAYIRGAFIASGSLSDPEKAYHMEFVNTDTFVAEQLLELINIFGLNAKMIERKSHFVVYIKEGEQIVDLLNIMNAHNALMALENLRILKDMRNNVNRGVNCETANLNKTVAASVIQQEDIKYIAQTRGLSYLSEQLAEVAQIRLQNPDSSLKEIGTMLVPAVGKSGVNHRLRKISEIAEALRGGLV